MATLYRQPELLRELAIKRKAERIEFDARVVEAIRQLGEGDLNAICHTMRLALDRRGNHSRVRSTLQRLRLRGTILRRQVETIERQRSFYRLA